MSVSTINIESAYAGNDVATSFLIGFDFIDNTQIKVKRTVIATSVESTLVVGIDYTLVGGDPATSILTTVAVPSTDTITVYRETPRVQSTSYVETGAFPARTHERALDRIVMMLQEIAGGSGSSGGGGALVNVGTYAVPTSIDATGINYSEGGIARQIWFVKSGGGEVDITTNPQIVAAATIGRELWIVGTSDADYFLLEDGNGLLLNGQWYSLAGNVLKLVWTGSLWLETGRSE